MQDANIASNSGIQFTFLAPSTQRDTASFALNRGWMLLEGDWYSMS